MEEIVFVLDESGAKGYSDNTENTQGEFGAMAGYFILEKQLISVKKDLDLIRSKFFYNDKVHITDLQPEQQESLRKNIFNYFIEKNIYWTYEAIYVQGYYEHANFMNQLSKKAHASRQSDIKISWSESRELLHSELFQGIFAKAIAFCLDNVGSKFKLCIITDRIDKPILKRFQQEADTFLAVGKDKTTEMTGFDPNTGQIVKGSITTKIVSKDIFDDFSDITYSISCEDSSLTLAADVLVNSLNYHLKSLQTKTPGVELNNEGNIQDHPLSNIVYGAWPKSKEERFFSDAIFMHPIQMKYNHD